MLRQILLFVMLSAPAWSQCPSSWDPTIGAPGANDDVRAFATFDEGAGPRLFAGGDFTQMGGIAAAHIARWDGTSWTTVGAGFDGPVYALGVYDDGSGRALYAGGLFQHAGGVPAANIARWNGTAWSALSFGTDAAVRAFIVYDDGVGSGPSLFAAGDFAHAGALQSPAIVRFNSSGISPVGSLSGGITDLAVFDDGSGSGRWLYASGFFTSSPTSYLLQRWNGNTWMDAPPGGPVDATVNAGTNTLRVFDSGTGPALYVGGTFEGTGLNNIARLDANGWSSMQGGVSFGDQCFVSDMIVHDDGTGPALWVTGYFQFAGGVLAGCLARWNGTSWSAPAGGLQISTVAGYGNCLLGHDDGHGRALFVGGDFAHDGAVAMHEVGRRSATGGQPIVSAPTGPASASVGDIVQFSASATGAGPLSYAWMTPAYGGGSTGADTPTITVEVLSLIQAQGDYRVVVTGPCGASISTAVHLAVNVGPGTPMCECQALAPCGNSAHFPTQGCSNSTGKSGWLSARGTASVANDTLVLLGQDMTSSSVLYFQGTSAVAGGGAVFGDGLRCAAGTVVRLGVHTNVNGVSQHPGPNDLPLSIAGGLSGNQTRVYQAWYRDAASFCTSATFNLTNGVRVTWQP